tara:strand:- start:3488 stop:3841 length:354 start_codon:yes stop_codon:yes gene_type:complete
MKKYKQNTHNKIESLNQNLANVVLECRKLRNELKMSNETNFYMRLEMDKLSQRINYLDMKMNKIIYDSNDDLPEHMIMGQYKDISEQVTSVNMDPTGIDQLLNNIENILYDRDPAAE